MDAKKALEITMRARMAYNRMKTVDAIGNLVTAIKGMGNTPYPLELSSNLRELVQLIGQDRLVVEALGAPIIFKTGEEQSLLVPLARAYKILAAGKEEDFATAIARKVKLDIAFNEGKRKLVIKDFSEADYYFNEALTHYKDEHALFFLIGKALMQAEAPRRAFPYLSKGVIADPEDMRMKALYDECLVLKEKRR